MTSSRFRTVPLIAATALIAGCGYFDTREEFVIRVESIDAPETVSATDTLKVRFYGSVGANSCYQLENVRFDRDANSLDITFYGRITQSRGSACLDTPTLLEHQETVLPPLQHPYVITVHQPDGTTLTKSVAVH